MAGAVLERSIGLAVRKLKALLGDPAYQQNQKKNFVQSGGCVFLRTRTKNGFGVLFLGFPHLTTGGTDSKERHLQVGERGGLPVARGREQTILFEPFCTVPVPKTVNVPMCLCDWSRLVGSVWCLSTVVPWTELFREKEPAPAAWSIDAHLESPKASLADVTL